MNGWTWALIIGGLFCIGVALPFAPIAWLKLTRRKKSPRLGDLPYYSNFNVIHAAPIVVQEERWRFDWDAGYWRRRSTATPTRRGPPHWRWSGRNWIRIEHPRPPL